MTQYITEVKSESKQNSTKMPFWNKSEKKSEKKGQPSNAPPPPVNPSYNTPQMAGAPPPYEQAIGPCTGAPYPQGAAGGPPGPTGYYPSPQWPSQYQGPPPPQGYAPPPPGAPSYHHQQQQQPAQRTTYVVQGAFDAGARFSGKNQPSIPPPPPGVAPNAAQMAQMQGHSVVATQRQGNFMTGGSDGGYVIW